MKKFIYGKSEYKYYLDKQERKTFALIISPSMSIILKTPLETKNKEINDFLKRKVFWIDKQLDFFKNFKKKVSKKEYVSGESFLYLGRRYMLKVEKSKNNKVFLKQGKIFIFSNKLKDQKFNKELLDKWFKEKMEKVFQERFEEILKKFDYDFAPELKTRKMSKRWGSYHSNGKVILNPLLIHATKKQIDYVITHELCHVKHQNHSKDFYGLMKQKFSKWELEKQKLENLIFNEF
ncbi:MAG: M48 family metallopeptidase [Candidatus Pacebacteria bacterium]|nr:M48 family metallopeptidase [Candidatus Paceibacterota bacterium]